MQYTVVGQCKVSAGQCTAERMIVIVFLLAPLGRHPHMAQQLGRAFGEPQLHPRGRFRALVYTQFSTLYVGNSCCILPTNCTGAGQRIGKGAGLFFRQTVLQVTKSKQSTHRLNLSFCRDRLIDIQVPFF